MALPLQAFTRTTYVGISLSVALERHKGRETLVRYVYRLNTGRFLEIRTTGAKNPYDSVDPGIRFSQLVVEKIPSLSTLDNLSRSC